MPKKDILNNIFNKKIDCSEDKCTDSSSSQFTINSQFSAKETDMSDTQEANNFPILIPGAPCSPPQKVIINYGVDGGIIDVGSLIQGDNIILTGNTVGRLVGIGDVVIEAVIPPVDLSNYYTKAETDTLLLGKLDVGALDDYYTKTELQTPGGAIVDWSNIANAPDFATDWASITGDQSVVGNAGFSNTANYITSADLPDLSNYIQQGDDNTLLANTAGYITLSDVPAQVNSDWNATSGVAEILNKPAFAAVAFSGDYDDLINTPAIPDLTGYATEQWVLDRNYLTSVTWGIITGDQSVIGNAGFSNTANYITLAQVPAQVNTDWNATSGVAQLLNKPALALVATSGDYDDLINAPIIPDLTGYATEQWVIDQDYATEQWVLNQNYITGVAWDEITGTQTDIEVGGFSNAIGYITGVTWGDITGLQSVIGNAGFNNTANYITLADIPAQVQADWLATTGLASILNKPVLATVATTGDYNDLINQPSIPDLTGYATEAWVTSQGYLTSVPWSFNSNTGDLTINGIAGSLDGRWLERADGVITPGYGITVNGDLATGMGIELDTTVVDNRYLRKDVSDANGAFKLTLGELESGDAEFTGTVTLGSVAMGTTNEILLYGPSGVIQRKTLEFEGSFGVANSGGTKQFDVDLGTNLRFAGTGDTVVSFNSSTNTITINSVPGQGGGGVITSVFGRTGPAIMAETGDYNTSQVPESGNLYFTQARVRATPLSGYSVGSNAAISASDTILSAFGKTQGQINSRVPTSRTVSISGTSGNIAISGTPTQNLGSNAAWTINLATVGTAGANKTKVTTDAYGRVTGSAALTLGDLPSGVTQTLSVGTTPGEFSISGGNTVTLSRLGRSNIADLSGFNVGQGFYPFYSTTGAVGFPSTVGGGILWNRNGTSGQFGGNFALWTAGDNAETLYYTTGTSTGYSSWKTIADRAWVTSQIPTNFVTTNTNQTGLSGTKSWTAAHSWSSTAGAPSTSNVVQVGGATGGQYLRIQKQGEATQSIIVRGYEINGVQLVLNEGGIDGPQGSNSYNTPILFAGGNPLLGRSTSGALSLMAWNSNLILKPNGTSTDGQVTIGTSGQVTIAGLSGGGTQMVVANGNGVLSRQAIPAVPSHVLTGNVSSAVNSANPSTHNFNTVTGSGMFHLSTASANSPSGTTDKTWALINAYVNSTTNAQIAIATGGSGFNSGVYYRNRQGNAWKELADVSQIPTNYVNTTGNQSGIVGTKSWNSAHTFNANTLTVHKSGGNSSQSFTDPHLKLTASGNPSQGDGIVGITMATSNSDNYGISLAALRGEASGATPTFVVRSHTNSAEGTEILKIHNTGQVTVPGLSGSSTGMVTVSAGGVLNRATIPSVGNGTLSMSTGAGLSGSASFSANQSGNATFSVAAASGYVIPTTTQRDNWNAAYSYSQIGHLNNSGGNVTRTVAGWPTSTVSSNTNYIERRIISLVSSNNGLHFFGNGTSNARRFGIQSAHNNSQYATTYGILELNPYGGEVRVNGGAVWHSGNLANGTTSQYIRGDGSLATFPSIPSGTVTSVSAGNGMSFSTITGSGAVTMGTPGTLTSGTSNSVTSTSHTHALGNDVWGSTTAALSGNLNDYTVAGHRSQTTSANATLANNYPWEGGGGSLINSGGSGTYRTQIFHNRVGTQIAWRARTSGSSWSTWKEFWHSSNFTPSNYTPTARTITLTGGTGITVSAGAQSLAANRTWTITNSSPNATHTGDVTGSTSLTIANNAVTTAKIINSAVTHAKYQNIATQRILGRGATGSGNVQELTLGANLSLSTAGVLSATNTVYTLPTATATVLGGIEIFSNTVQSVAANSVTTTASRTYGIQLNSAGQAVVNVPWTNTNTTYTAGNGLVLTGTSFAVGAGSGISVAASAVAVDATVLRTTGNQSASGVKTFTGELVANNLRLGTVANTTTTINMNANNLVRLNAISSNTTYTLSNNSDGRQVQCTVTNSGGSNVSVTVAGAILLGTNIIGAGKSAVISVINFGGGQLRYTVTPEL